MKRMTDTELDARIAQFMDRKKEDFPSLFGRYESSPGTKRVQAFTHYRLGAY
jgi:hypothetical protein